MDAVAGAAIAPYRESRLDLEAFLGAGWNPHDVDFLTTFMSDECIFETTAGPEACGTRYGGREREREAFARVLKEDSLPHAAVTRHEMARVAVSL